MVVYLKEEIFKYWQKLEKNLTRSQQTNLCFDQILKDTDTDAKLLSEQDELDLKSKIDNVLRNFQRHHQKLSKKPKALLEKIQSLEPKYLEFSFANPLPDPVSPLAEPLATPTSSTGKRGRPSTDYGESSTTSKYRKTDSPVSKYSAGQLGFALQRKLKGEGKLKAAKVLSMSMSSPTKADKLDDAYKKVYSSTNPTSLTAEEALALMIRTRSSVSSYKEHIHEANIHNHKHFYPPYDDVLVAKKMCYPSDDYINISDNDVNVDFTALMHHTFTRICSILKSGEDSLFKKLNLNEIKYFEPEVKIGSDGTTGLSEYKFVKERELKDESCVFLTSTVPLKLYAVSDKGQKTLVWKNPKPSSSRFCRPLRMQFRKETQEITKAEKTRLEECFKNVPDLTIDVEEDTQILIKFKEKNFHYTMLDGKVINVLTGSSDSSCRFCQAKPKKLNEIDYLLSLEVSEDCKKYGICPMHARIRFVDLVLNVSYRDEEPNRVKFVTLPDPEKKNKRKYEIQRQFRTQMGLKVDYPAKGGSGNTTDGNTSRKIFANTQKSSEITGFDKEILNRFSVILDTINSGYQVDSQKFKEFY